jgi:predicted nuclease of restriction endonuclease-like (RecB) superfamily
LPTTAGRRLRRPGGAGPEDVSVADHGEIAAAPEGYPELLEQLKTRVRTAQLRAARAANTEVLTLYWSIERDILDRQHLAGWGARIVDRLATDLRAEFPDHRGWSRRNLQYMRALAVAWPDLADFVHQPGAQLPWRHLTTPLDRVDSAEERTWYAAQAATHGWSRAVLEHQIAAGLRHRIGAAPSNFTDQLPPGDSDLARDLLRDPYIFDHLTVTGPVAEHDLEQALMDRLQATLLEFGHGMAFVGRQVRFDVDGDELVVDLLLFHVEQLRYVVVELKIDRFEPAHIGQTRHLRRCRRGPPAPARPPRAHHRAPSGRRAQRQDRPLHPVRCHRAPRRRRLHLRGPPRGRPRGAALRRPPRRRPRHHHPRHHHPHRHRQPRPLTPVPRSAR